MFKNVERYSPWGKSAKLIIGGLLVYVRWMKFDCGCDGRLAGVRCGSGGRLVGGPSCTRTGVPWHRSPATAWKAHLEVEVARCRGLCVNSIAPHTSSSVLQNRAPVYPATEHKEDHRLRRDAIPRASCSRSRCGLAPRFRFGVSCGSPSSGYLKLCNTSSDATHVTFGRWWVSLVSFLLVTRSDWKVS